MAGRVQAPTERPSIGAILGYLNFSSGTPDSQFLAHLNDLFAQSAGAAGGPAWREAVRALEAAMPRLASTSATFADLSQARAVVRLLGELLPAYRTFHADLLFHQAEEALYGAFFVGRACEAILQQGAPWEETHRVVSGALARLNDYVGYRPVAMLESHRHEAYPHEWLRPVPLYIQGAGVESGRYAAVVARALEILRGTDERILRAAYLDPELLTELAWDPRAFDFDHPVHKRPNYHFGQWDPHHIDAAGRYRRFVLQQVTLDALCARVEEEASELPRDELLFEAAAVLAGTMLMASGISGSGPGSFDSSVTLATLLPAVAAYRDAFYEQLLTQTTAAHRHRLAREAEQRHQPFGAARQHLNAWLARCRARQLEHVHLAKIFARMGHADAAMRQAQIVPVASARLQCEIDCRLTAGNQAVQRGALTEALAVAQDVTDLVHRAIGCGAVIDPWNLLGFDAHFSLFPALENSVHDHRADDLVALMDHLFSLYSRIWSAAAAQDAQDVCQQVGAQFERAASWWRQFAAHEVSSVDAVDAQEVFRAAEHVAESLHLWHQGGAEAGDLRFWAPHAHRFSSPKAFGLVVQALLEHDDTVASMSLLVHWLSQADHVPLEQGAHSFHALAQQWLLTLLQQAGETTRETPGTAAPSDLVRRFFELLEANADHYWEVPEFALAGPHAAADPSGAGLRSADVAPYADPEDDEPPEEADKIYSAAYDDVVYTDSADDGIDGPLFDTGDATNDELSRESHRLVDRVTFLSSLARLWKLAAVHGVLAAGNAPQVGSDPPADRETLQPWIRQTITNHRRLLALLDQVRRYRIPLAGPDPDALMQYDRQRMVKDALLERIAASCIDVADASHMLLAAYAAQVVGDDPGIGRMSAQVGAGSRELVDVLAEVLRGDQRAVRDRWPALLESLAGQSLLYVPLSKDGAPGRESPTRQYVAARCRQVQLQNLLAWLPRRGLWLETCQLIETARRMERNNPVGPGAVTEFDELFKTGYRALVDSLVTSAASWERTPGLPPEKNLVAALESLTEVLLGSWLQHSRTLRLSVLERIAGAGNWERLVTFIQRYGAEIFTQRFLSLGNVRGILHQGVGNWLASLEEDRGPETSWRLLQDLDGRLNRQEAVEILSLALEAVLENYGEYRDYNSTTTQSDRGDLLYTFLDFLRLRTEYDRICWHLKPVVLAHEVLVTRRQDKAARLWRRALTERIVQEADHYVQRLRELQATYAMRMPTVADRIAERFARPMVIDRMRALVRPAMEEAQRAGPTPVLELLEYETQQLAGEATGLGFDLPVWLLALEDEVDQVREPAQRRRAEHQLVAMMPCVTLSRDEMQRQLAACTRDAG